MYFINGKYNYEGGNKYESNDNTTLIQRGKVISLEDPNDAGRIKVRIVGVDNDKTDEELPFAFPMLPKHINIMPKIKEGVLIFMFATGNDEVDRMYLGPVVPQPQFLENADYDLEAWNGYTFGTADLGAAPSQRRKLKGGYPDKRDVSLQGRKNTDLILKDNEVLLRAGKFVFQGDAADNSKSPSEFDEVLGHKFNSRTQGYIQIKYNAQTNVPEDEEDDKEYGTITNIVSNKINLLTHKEGNPRFTLANQENLISDEEMQRILSEAHQLVFGDKLIELLKLMMSAITNHSHKYNGLPAHGDGESAAALSIQEMLQYNLEQLLSKNIRIN